MHEQKYRYFIDGKEVDNRTDYLNATMSGDYVSYFDGNSVFSVSFSDFFAENKDNNKMIKREVKGHVNSVLGGYNKPIINSNSTRHKARENGEAHKGFSNTFIKVKLSPSQKEKLETVRELSNQILAEKTEKEEDLVFPKDSEIHKEGTTVFVKNNSGFNYLKKEIKTTEAYKETEGKLFYELDWGFITQMAERMASNKKDSKYSLWNWKKPMTPKVLEDLKQAMWRHILAVMSGEFEDDGREFGHLEAISNNAMMINYQLKNK